MDGQLVFRPNMTPLQKMTALHTVTDLVLQFMTDRMEGGRRKITDLKNDVSQEIAKVQYALFVNPATAVNPNPTIGHISLPLREFIERLGYENIFKQKGGRRLVGAGIPEQIQHHDRRLEKAHASLMRLIKKKNKLLDRAREMVNARNARGEELDPEVMNRIREAMADIENKIEGRRQKIEEIAEILANLQAQMP